MQDHGCNATLPIVSAPSVSPKPSGIAVKAGDCPYSGNSSSSSVHTLETKSPPAPGEFITILQSGSPDFPVEPVLAEDSTARHKAHAHRRWQAWEALNRCHFPQRRLELFANCGSGAWLQRSAAGDDLRIVSNKCHDRWCPACSAEKARKLHTNLSDRISLVECRFYTFTLRHSKTPLTDQIDRLYRSFAILRRRADFREHITGGIAFFEGKVSDNSSMLEMKNME